MNLMRMRAVREAKGMTLEQIAEAVGVSKATVSRHECGKRQASVKAVRAYARALRMSRRWHTLVGD